MQDNNDFFSKARSATWFAVLRATFLPPSAMTKSYQDFRRMEKAALVFFLVANAFKIASFIYGFWAVVIQVSQLFQLGSISFAVKLELIYWILSCLWLAMLIPGNLVSIYRSRAVILGNPTALKGSADSFKRNGHTSMGSNMSVSWRFTALHATTNILNLTVYCYALSRAYIGTPSIRANDLYRVSTLLYYEYTAVYHGHHSTAACSSG